jgi:type I restriction enzyme, S subunit
MNNLQTNCFDEWTDTHIRDLISGVVGGGTPSRIVPEFWNGDIPWASVKDFDDEQIFLDQTQEFISSKGLIHSAANLIEPGTVLICTRMAVGRAAICTRPTAINQDIKALHASDILYPKFLLFLIGHIRAQLDLLSSGSTVKGLNIQHLLALRVRAPSLPEQRRIAEILDIVDDAIHANKEVIAKLKQLKATLLHI